MRCGISLCVLMLAWGEARDAEACSCASGTDPVWPAPDSDSVPTNTTLALTSLFADLVLAVPSEVPAGADPTETLPNPGVVLKDDFGAAVFLESVRSFESYRGCSARFELVRPITALQPNTRYTLFDGDVPRIQFTTGLGPRDAALDAERALGLDYHLAGPSNLLSSVFVDGLGEEPLLIHTTGALPATYLARTLASQDPLKLSPGFVECMRVEVISIDGVTLDERELCHPERCFESAQRMLSSCDMNTYDDLSWAEFANLPAGNCAMAGTDSGASEPSGGSLPEPSPPPDEPEGDRGATDDDATEERASSDSQDSEGVNTRGINEDPDSGCAFASGNAAAGRVGVLGVALVGVLAFQQRRVQKRPGRKRCDDSVG